MAWPTLSAREQSRKDEAFSIYMLTHSRSLSLRCFTSTHTLTNIDNSHQLKCARAHTHVRYVCLLTLSNINTFACMCPCSRIHTFAIFCKWHSQHITHHSMMLFYLLYSQIEHMTQKPWNNLYEMFKLPWLLAEVKFSIHFFLMCIMSRSTEAIYSRTTIEVYKKISIYVVDENWLFHHSIIVRSGSTFWEILFSCREFNEQIDATLISVRLIWTYSLAHHKDWKPGKITTRTKLWLLAGLFLPWVSAGCQATTIYCFFTSVFVQIKQTIYNMSMAEL